MPLLVSLFYFFLKIYKIVSSSSEMPDGWNFPYAITHQPATFACLLSCLRTTSISLTHQSPLLIVSCQPWKKLSSAFKQAIDMYKMQPKPSEPSPSTKAEDLLAFCTITMMLSFIQSTTGQLRCTATMTAPLGTNWEDHRSLRILDALSTVLVREHEVIAVMVKPYDGSDVQVLASMVQPTNE